MLKIAFLAPKGAIGEKATLIGQPWLFAGINEQPVSALNSAWFVPTMVTEPITRSSLPLFLSVTNFSLDVFPTCTDPILTGRGEADILGVQVLLCRSVIVVKLRVLLH